MRYKKAKFFILKIDLNIYKLWCVYKNKLNENDEVLINEFWNIITE